MASNYTYSGASSSATSYTYSYVDEEPVKVATITKTKPPAQEWSDVIGISIVGVHYEIDQTVVLNRGTSSQQFARIEEFKPERVVLVTDKDETVVTSYKYMTFLKYGEKGFVTPNPNRAFKRRKDSV